MTPFLLVFTLLAQAPAVAPVDPGVEKGSSNDEVTSNVGRLHGLPPEAVAKLSGEQLHDILTRKERDPPAIAGLAVIAFFSSSTLMVFGVLFAIYRVYRQRSETLRLMVEKGVSIPPELIAPAPKPENDLRRGLVLAAFGLGLAIFLMAVADARGMWTLGLIPLLVGVGYMAASRISKPATA